MILTPGATQLHVPGREELTLRDHAASEELGDLLRGPSGPACLGSSGAPPARGKSPTD